MKFVLSIALLCISVICINGAWEKLQSSDSVNNVTIAKIAGKEITLNDFVQRAEYTLRAPYCKGNTNNDKNIVLNTLIAEKILSLDQDDSQLLQNEKFREFITGRREQKMRELLYYNEGVQKVSLDTSEIKTVFVLAGRTYNVQYFNINDNHYVNTYLQKFSGQDSSFEKFFSYYGIADSIRERTIGWNSPEASVIHKSLYSKVLNKDDIIGPLRIDENINLLIKIKGWNNRVVISEKDIRARYDEVTEKLASLKADSIYDKYVLKVMHNKSIRFNNDNFNRLIKILSPFYVNRKEESKNEFIDLVFKSNIELPDLSKSSSEYADIAELPVFEIDSKTWSIAGLKKEIDKHPLVFRKSSKNEPFAEQLRLAIVDLVRDIYLTQEAYKNGFDESEIVKHYEESWLDASLALFHRDNYLKTKDIDPDKPLEVSDQYLNPYIKQKFKEYSDQIFINVKEYNKIKLTRTDMFTTQSDVPYPIYVPAFPHLTTYNRLDYGKKLD